MDRRKIFCLMLVWIVCLSIQSLHCEDRTISLEYQEIKESSGVAVSLRTPNTYWTHNDSGDVPRIFAFDDQGKHLGEIRVDGAKAIDWEDLACFQWHHRSWIMLADTGDNARMREHVTLYAFPEPRPDAKQVQVERVCHVRFPAGPMDCEAIAFDSDRGRVLLIEKSALPSARVWSVAWPSENDSVRAELVTRIPIPFVTSATFNSVKHCLLVGTYADAFAYIQAEDKATASMESWSNTLARFPQTVRLPKRPQSEGIAMSSDGERVIVTSEGRPTPVWMIPFFCEPDTPVRHPSVIHPSSKPK